MSYKQTIYDVFRRHGLTEAAALAFLGNWQCESGNEPFRLQGDFSPYRTASKAYVQGVENGSISRDSFANDQKGFGLAQWTYFSRKYALYDYWKASGKALDSAEMQTEFAMTELQKDYKALLEFLKITTDIFTACSRICREYERPAVNNIDARYDEAKKIKNEIDLDGGGDEPEPTVDHSLRLRTIDKNCSGFDEVYLLQALLLCRNYDVIVDGKWGGTLTAVVKDFQKYAFPNDPKEWDGIVGQGTWAKLMERGV